MVTINCDGWYWAKRIKDCKTKKEIIKSIETRLKILRKELQHLKPPKQMKREFKNQIEDIINETSVAALLQAISNICYDKSTQLDENSKYNKHQIWNNAGKKIEKLSDSIDI